MDLFWGMKKKKQQDPELQAVAERITEIRKQLGYTNYEYFAYEHNIPRAQYGRYEQGQDMRLSSFFKVLKALGVNPIEFFSEGFDFDDWIED